MLTMQPAEAHASATTDIQVLHGHALEEAEASGAGHVREDSATQPAEDTAVAPTTEELNTEQPLLWLSMRAESTGEPPS